MAPNIFEYATKELSQDAFFGWLLAWGDKKYEGDPLNAASLEFVNFLLKLHNKQKVDTVSITVHMQHYRADIVAEVGMNDIILIEDKINAKEGEGKLEKYATAIGSAYPGKSISAIYLKTGDQSNYSVVHKAGFATCLREQILEILAPWDSKITNAIFNDFIANISSLQRDTESYLSRNVGDWTKAWYRWVGFYKCLQRKMPYDVEWDYVHNQTGGFLGAWWLFEDWTDPKTGRVHRVYLQIEHEPLCFKIEVAEDETDNAGVRDRWHSVLMAEAARSGMNILRPAKMGNGHWMTVARVEPNDWIFKTADCRIDIDRTIDYLYKATKMVQQAAKQAEQSLVK